MREVGFSRATDHGHADLVILNTCTVTAAADAQARDAIRHIRAANPSARVLVTGCYAQRAPEELAGLAGVEWVVGNSHQSEIPAVLRAAVAAGPPAGAPRGNGGFVSLQMLVAKGLPPATATAFSPLAGPAGAARIITGDIFAQEEVLVAPVDRGAGDRTRPTLKIQDGCNNRCSYCVIPYVRGKSRSLAPDRVVIEIGKLVEAGAKEVVLSGINLGSYGRDLTPRVALLAVVRRVLNETRIDRLRFSSIEPMDVTRDFVEFVAAEPRLAPHFHVPLQSGSDRVLRAMHRWYRAGHYESRIEVIRECLPDAGIGADIIAGYPGESEEDFRATEELIARLPFTYLHVFSFSARPGTAAASLEGQVPAAVVRARARRLREIAAHKSVEFRRSQAGRTLRALTLRPKKGGPGEALTGNFLKVRTFEAHPANTWVDVRIS